MAISVYKALILAAESGAVPKNWLRGSDNAMFISIINGLAASLGNANIKREILMGYEETPGFINILTGYIERFVSEQVSELGVLTAK
jgi:hypothetical protein